MKRLPNGTWISFGNLAPDTTEEEIQTYLFDAGIELPLDRIAVSVDRDGMRALAIVWITKAEVFSLVERAVGPAKVHGRTPKLFMPQSQIDWDDYQPRRTR